MFAFPLKDDDLGLLGLAGLFDLLARFDYEDRLKEKSVPGSESPVPSPGNSALGPDPE